MSEENERLTKDKLYERLDELIEIQDPIYQEYRLARVAKEIQVSEETLHRLIQARELQREKAKNTNLISQFFYALGGRLKNLDESLSDMSFFSILEYVSKLSILLGIFIFLSEIPARQAITFEKKQETIYEAWQVIRDNKTELFGTDLIIALETLNKTEQSLKDIDVSNAQLSNTKDPLDLTGAFLNSANFNNASANQAVFDRAELGSSSFVESKLYQASFQSAYLYDANFKNAQLNEVDFQGTNREPTELQKADFSGAELNGAIFSQSNVAGANFCDSYLTDTDFRGAIGLKKEQIVCAENWEGAKFDPEFYEQLPRKSKENEPLNSNQ